MVSGLDLIQKIHAGGETVPGSKYDQHCFTAILKDWDDTLSYEQLMIADALDQNTFYDKFYSFEKLHPVVQGLIDEGTEDSYFSINSFWIKSKTTSDIRHLNAFALDFDYYKKERYKDLDASEFYDILKKDLPIKPTAVVDSGRGLYVIYSFNHCSKSMLGLYKAIYKEFSEQYKKYGLDAAATNVTQVIRIPGTCNSRSLKEVRILEYNDTNYELTDFASILKHTYQEVVKYKELKKQDTTIEIKKTISSFSYTKNIRRTKWFKNLFEDFKLLIQLRNNDRDYEGYRECMLYITRERATWSGQSIDESIKTALRLNEHFHYPLSKSQIENQCKPSKLPNCCSIDTIINKLNILPHEQLKLKLLKSKRLKDSLFNKRSKRHKLLNRTEKELKMLERRTRVFHLKRIGIKNVDIAAILTIDKSTVTKDLDYIMKNKSEFRIKLADMIQQLTTLFDTPAFLKRVTYDSQQKLLEWLKIGPKALLNSS